MSRGLRLFALLAMGCSEGCAGRADATSSTACTSIGPPPDPQLPTVDATGAKATAITDALSAIFATQTPPIAPGSSYSIPSLDCGDVEPPMGSGGYECTMEVQVGQGQPRAVDLPENSEQAENLFNALLTAGSSTCPSTFGPHVAAQDLAVSASGVVTWVDVE